MPTPRKKGTCNCNFVFSPFPRRSRFFLFRQPSPWCQLSLTSAVAVCLHAGRLRDSEDFQVQNKDIIIAPGGRIFKRYDDYLNLV